MPPSFFRHRRISSSNLATDAMRHTNNRSRYKNGRQLSTTPRTSPMPGRHIKQVRFAYKNTFHSAPPTPALSFSVSTLPSSSGVPTPSSASFGLPPPSPYARDYFPTTPTKSSHHGGRTTPHRYFTSSAISWDLRDRPSTITRNHHPLAPQSLHEPATSPPMPFIRITSSYLPWSIKVSASNGAFVTVGEVAEAVYRALRKNISQSEFGLITSPSDQRRATRAYEDRYRRLRSTGGYDEEKRAGMKRVDFLMGLTHFMGITNDGHRPDEWHLAMR